MNTLMMKIVQVSGILGEEVDVEGEGSIIVGDHLSLGNNGRVKRKVDGESIIGIAMSSLVPDGCLRVMWEKAV